MIHQKQDLFFDKEAVHNQLKNLESAEQLAQILYDAVNDERSGSYWLNVSFLHWGERCTVGWGVNCCAYKLKYFADTSNGDYDRLRIFNIPKRKGGFREIVAPKHAFRVRLKAILKILQSYEEATPWAYGFVQGRSVADNAALHTGKNFVLNIDLSNFFPSITREQVKQVLSAKPFEFSPFAVDFISGLCTYRKDGVDVLAQGFPTSPLLSNFVCRQMDEDIAKVAAENNVTFSRYADDITFSSDVNVFDFNGAFYNRIKEIISSYGFVINQKKVRLQSKTRHQEVTGIVVNKKLNVSRRYIREIRTLLFVWKKYGYEAACCCAYRNNRKKDYHKYYYSIEESKFLRGKINYLGIVRGKDDSIYLRFKAQFDELYKNESNVMKSYSDMLEKHRLRRENNSESEEQSDKLCGVSTNDEAGNSVSANSSTDGNGYQTRIDRNSYLRDADDKERRKKDRRTIILICFAFLIIFRLLVFIFFKA
jgi:retron-type reverse transcriptase